MFFVPFSMEVESAIPLQWAGRSFPGFMITGREHSKARHDNYILKCWPLAHAASSCGCWRCRGFGCSLALADVSPGSGFFSLPSPCRKPYTRLQDLRSCAKLPGCIATSCPSPQGCAGSSPCGGKASSRGEESCKTGARHGTNLRNRAPCSPVHLVRFRLCCASYSETKRAALNVVQAERGGAA